MTNLSLIFKSIFTVNKKCSSNIIASNKELVKTTKHIREIKVKSPYEFDSKGNLTAPFRPFVLEN